MSNNTLDRGSSTGGAISFSKGSPIVEVQHFPKTTFILHYLLPLMHPAAVQVFDCYFEGIIKNNNRPQINLVQVAKPIQPELLAIS